MSLVPLRPPSPAMLGALLVRRGVPAVQADASARGLEPVVLLVEPLPGPQQQRLLSAAASAGVESVTGRDWVLLVGAASRLGALLQPETGALDAELASRLGAQLTAVLEPPRAWDVGPRGTLSLDEPLVVGILNVTPDSFSDGGRYLDPERALAQAAALVEAGAGMLDLGAESTRPGATTVSAAEEWRRLAPVVEGLVARFPNLPISVDTVKAETARRALAAGAWAINDVSGLRLDPRIAEVCAEYEAGLILMHSRGDVGTMASYAEAQYADVVSEMARELARQVALAEERGVPRRRIVLDPGLGFAKTPEQSYQALRGVGALAALGHPVMIGPSRKRFLGAVTGRAVGERDVATAAACALGWWLGARLFRVHAVEPVRDALAVARAIEVS